MPSRARWLLEAVLLLIPLALLVVFFTSLTAFFRGLGEPQNRQAQAVATSLETLWLRPVDEADPRSLHRARDLLEARLRGLGVQGFRLEVQGKALRLGLPPIEGAQREELGTLLTQRGEVSFHLVQIEAADKPLAQLRPSDLEAPLLTNRDLERVQAGQSPSGRPALVLYLRREGAARFARLSVENLGRRVALRVDGRIVLAPTIRAPIASRALRLQGFASQEEVERLAALLQAGPLPIALELVKTAPGP